MIQLFRNRFNSRRQHDHFDNANDDVRLNTRITRHFPAYTSSSMDLRIAQVLLRLFRSSSYFQLKSQSCFQLEVNKYACMHVHMFCFLCPRSMHCWDFTNAIMCIALEPADDDFGLHHVATCDPTELTLHLAVLTVKPATLHEQYFDGFGLMDYWIRYTRMRCQKYFLSMFDRERCMQIVSKYMCYLTQPQDAMCRPHCLQSKRVNNIHRVDTQLFIVLCRANCMPII